MSQTSLTCVAAVALCPGAGVLVCVALSLGGLTAGALSPCLWRPGPPRCGESVAWGVSLRTSASVGVSSAFALPLRDGPHLSRRVRLWAAPGVGSRHVGALGLTGGQASSHRSAGHGVMGCRAHGSPPACSQGHLCWEHGGGFVLPSSWPETPGPFQCGPRPLPSVLQAVSSPPPGPRADGAPQAVESLGRPPCGSRALSPDEAATGLCRVTLGGSVGEQSCPAGAVIPAVFLAVFGAPAYLC